MKRILIILAGLLVLAAGAYFYYTWKISNQVDKLASQVAPIGTLNYDGVSLGLGGEARINGITFGLHGSTDRIRIRRIALRADNLYALWSLSSQLEDGRVPRSMGLSLRGLELAVDSDMYKTAQAGSFAGLSFDAAGCGDRQVFTPRDLTGMDFWDLLIDMDVRYRLLDQGRNMEISLRSRTHQMVEFDVRAVLELGTMIRDFQTLAASMTNARLESISMDYVDLGYYPRMLEYCSGDMNMTRSEYIDHHIRAWRDRWRQLELEAGESTVAAYRRFIESPDRLELILDPSYSPRLSQFQGGNPMDTLYQFKPQVSVNNGPAEPLEITALDDARVATADTLAESLEPTEPALSAGTPDMSEDSTTKTGDPATESPQPQVPAQPDSSWTDISPGQLSEYFDHRVELVTRDGKSYSGRVDRVDDARVHVQVRQRGGFFIIPVRSEEIASARVRPD